MSSIIRISRVRIAVTKGSGADPKSSPGVERASTVLASTPAHDRGRTVPSSGSNVPTRANS
ncbi:hypothetical protein [Haloarcula brevis]|uniref:hypothetical protein n=1 Tax=Haloarcula brevis TaxID=3111453 RepID=UPI00300F61EE